MNHHLPLRAGSFFSSSTISFGKDAASWSWLHAKVHFIELYGLSSYFIVRAA
jgi:hypothetical protein